MAKLVFWKHIPMPEFTKGQQPANLKALDKNFQVLKG